MPALLTKPLNLFHLSFATVVKMHNAQAICSHGPGQMGEASGIWFHPGDSEFLPPIIPIWEESADTLKHRKMTVSFQALWGYQKRAMIDQRVERSGVELQISDGRTVVDALTPSMTVFGDEAFGR